jgi:phosphoglycolate phosphatase
LRGLILFDIDGTLLRPGDKAHQQALVMAMRDVFDVPVDLEGVPLAGMLDSQIARIALARRQVPPDEIRAGLNQVMDRMGRHYASMVNGEERRSWLLPGVLPLLERLADTLVLAVMTGNARGVAHAKLRAAGIGHYFEIGSFGDTAEERHELVEVAVDAVEHMHGIRFVESRTVIIGDTPRDIEAGRLAGVSVAAVATGRFSVDVLGEHQPDLLFEDLSDVDTVERALVATVTREDNGADGVVRP